MIILTYEDVPVGEHRLDLLVEKVLLVDLKTVKALEPIFFTIGRSQMKAAGIEDGLLLPSQLAEAMDLPVSRLLTPLDTL